MQDELEQVTGQLGEAEGELGRQAATIARLEDDLLTAQRLGAAAAQHGSGSQQELVLRGLAGGDDWGSDASSEQSMVRREPAMRLPVGTLPNASHIPLLRNRPQVQVLVSQRERLRTRVKELDDTVGQLRARVAQLETELASSKSDNVALVERLRYVRDYQSGGAGAGADKGRTRRHNAHDVEAGGASGAIESKYLQASSDEAHPRETARPFASAGRWRLRLQIPPTGSTIWALPPVPLTMPPPTDGVRAYTCAPGRTFGSWTEPDGLVGLLACTQDYEASINPFQEFRDKQREMRVKQLRIAERAVLSTSGLLLSNRKARMFAFFYTLVIHAFLILLLVRYVAHLTAAAVCPWRRGSPNQLTIRCQVRALVYVVCYLQALVGLRVTPPRERLCLRPEPPGGAAQAPDQGCRCCCRRRDSGGRGH